MEGIQSGMKEHLSRLDEIFATRGDFVKTLKFMQQLAENLIKQLLGLPDWEQAKVDLTYIADRTAAAEYN
ncbi:protein tweety-like 2, partial [Silurus asotus]